MVSMEAREVYDFIIENPYTINRGAGMALDYVLAPDMSKLIPVAEKEGIDIYTYKEFFQMYISKKTDLEEAQRKKQEKTKS